MCKGNLFIVLTNIFVVYGQYVQSPCPDYFDYKSDSNGVYGEINLQPFGEVSTLLLRANFTIGARLSSSFAGSIQPIGSEMYLLQNFNRGVPLRYRVNFPTTSPLPKLVKLTVNDNLICYGPGDQPGHLNYVTTISLQHMLFYKSGSDGFREVYRPQPPPPAPPPPKEYRPQPPPPPKPVNQPTFNEYPSPGPEYVPNNDDLLTYYQYQQTPEPEVYTTKGAPTPITRATTRPTVRTTTEKTLPAYEPPRRPVEYGSSNSLECGVKGSHEQHIMPLVYQGSSYDKGEWPWLVAIYKAKFTSLSYVCAGTLISDRHVVTAAHCMQRKSVYTAMKYIVVKVGVYNLDDWSDDIITRNLAGAAIHESYNATTLANDILVLTLDKSVPFSSFIKPACLWSGNTELNQIVGSSGIVAGWGANEMGPGGKGEPRMVSMPIVSTATCKASKLDFHRLTSSKTLCAGDRKGAGPCLGDSGGGLYLLNKGRWRLRGVVSLSLWSENGESLCNLNDYVVFTDTAQFLPWINEVMANTLS